MNGNRGCCFNHDRALGTAGTNRSGPFGLAVGFTLLEVMIVLAVLSILMVALQSPVEHFHRMVFQQQVASDVTMSIQRAQLLLKSELVQAGYGLSFSDQGEAFEIDKGILSFKADLNRDGDVNDSKEQISYRFDANKQMLLRKSGKSAYQRFVEGVTEVIFEYWPSPNEVASCLKMTTQISGQTKRYETVLCRPSSAYLF